MATALSRSDKRLKKYYISDEMDRREDEEEAENGGSEHESVSSECEIEGGNCEDTEAETDNKNGEIVELVKVNTS
jgi:hypothetical protein